LLQKFQRMLAMRRKITEPCRVYSQVESVVSLRSRAARMRVWQPERAVFREMLTVIQKLAALEQSRARGLAAASPAK
jgi:hypothetical protein